MDIIWVLLKIAGIFILEVILIIVLKATSYRIKIPSMRIICEPDVPDYVKLYLNDCSKRLGKFNFVFSHYIYNEGMVIGSNSNNWGVVLINKSRYTYAVIKITDYPHVSNPYTADFITFFTNGNSIHTMNDKRHLLIGKMPDRVINDPYAITIEQHWYSHLNAISSMKNSAVPVIYSCERMIEQENWIMKKYVDSLLLNNYFAPSKNDLYRMRIFPSIKYAFRMIKGLSRHLYLRRQKTRITSEFIVIPDGLIIEKYKNLFPYEITYVNCNNKRILPIELYMIIIAGLLFSLDFILIGLVIVLLYEVDSRLNKVFF